MYSALINCYANSSNPNHKLYLTLTLTLTLSSPGWIPVVINGSKNIHNPKSNPNPHQFGQVEARLKQKIDVLPNPGAVKAVIDKLGGQG